MAVSKAQQKAVQKYVSEKYDRVMLTMPKGRKAEIQSAADAKGESLNGFITGAINDRMADFDATQSKEDESNA